MVTEVTTVGEPERMLNATRRPTAGEVAEWIGPRNAARWAELARFIDANYPGVFQPEWLFAGKKHGWALRGAFTALDSAKALADVERLLAVKRRPRATS